MSSNIGSQIVQGNTVAQSGGVPPALFASASAPKRSAAEAYDNQDTGKSIKTVVFLTTSVLEHKEIESHLRQTWEDTTDQDAIYIRGWFKSDSCNWEVAIALIGSENIATEVQRATSYFHSSLEVFLFIDTVHGINDRFIGDVVMPLSGISECIIGETNTFQVDPARRFLGYRLEQRARAEARKELWLQRAYPDLDHPSASVHISFPVVAVANTNYERSELLRFLKANYPNAFISDMKGLNFLEALEQTGALANIVYGVCNSPKARTTLDGQEPKEIAAKHAVAFAFEMLAKLHGANPSVAGTIEEPPVAIITNDLPIGAARLLATEAESDGFCHICVFHNGKKYEESGKLARLLGQLVQTMESYNNAIDTCSFLIRCNQELRRDLNCPVNKVMQSLSATGFFGSQDSYLMISDKIGLPWEFLEVDGVSIGVSIQTIYTFEEGAAFVDSYACQGEVLRYGGQPSPIKSYRDFAALNFLAIEMKSCGTLYGLLLIDGHSISMPIQDPTFFFSRSAFFSDHNRIVFVNGRVDFTTSFTHEEFLDTLHRDLGACGVIGTRTAIDSNVANKIADLFLRTVRTQPTLTVPAILTSMRSWVNTKLDENPTDPDLPALYLAVFQYSYYGKPYATLQLRSIDDS
jgi:hypothetical protein